MLYVWYVLQRGYPLWGEVTDLTGLDWIGCCVCYSPLLCLILSLAFSSSLACCCYTYTLHIHKFTQLTLTHTCLHLLSLPPSHGSYTPTLHSDTFITSLCSHSRVHSPTPIHAHTHAHTHLSLPPSHAAPHTQAHMQAMGLPPLASL